MIIENWCVVVVAHQRDTDSEILDIGFVWVSHNSNGSQAFYIESDHCAVQILRVHFEIVAARSFAFLV
jgi:hypothetical protein